MRWKNNLLLDQLVGGGLPYVPAGQYGCIAGCSRLFMYRRKMAYDSPEFCTDHCNRVRYSHIDWGIDSIEITYYLRADGLDLNSGFPDHIISQRLAVPFITRPYRSGPVRCLGFATLNNDCLLALRQAGYHNEAVEKRKRDLVLPK